MFDFYYFHTAQEKANIFINEKCTIEKFGLREEKGKGKKRRKLCVKREKSSHGTSRSLVFGFSVKWSKTLLALRDSVREKLSQSGR